MLGNCFDIEEVENICAMLHKIGWKVNRVDGKYIVYGIYRRKFICKDVYALEDVFYKLVAELKVSLDQYGLGIYYPEVEKYILNKIE